MRTTTPALLGLALLAGPTGALRAADAPTPDCPAPVLRHGERLFYRATASKGIFSSDVGNATLSVHHTPAPSTAAGWRIVARAQGSTWGHTLDAHVVSTLDPTGQACREYAETQAGDNAGGRRLEFGENAVVYRKLKHCPGCDSRAHRDGRHHCKDHRCGDPAHDIWRLRHRHAPDATISDPLTALYRARALDLRVGGPDRLLRICAGHGVFDVTVRATGTERCRVPAGTFDALRIELIPRPAPGTPSSARFQGLFGLTGTITVLVDAETKVPLRITGVVPMGIDVHCEVELTRIQAAPARAEPRGRASGATR